MEQAVRRTADYDLERSVAMREAKIKEQEGFPVYKDYGEEGYRWIELAPPKELPAGYRVLQSDMGEGFKVVDAAGNEAVATASRPTNNMGHTNIPFHKTEEEAIADALNRSRFDTQPQLAARRLQIFQQHVDDLRCRPVAEQLAQRLLVERNAALAHMRRRKPSALASDQLAAIPTSDDFTLPADAEWIGRWRRVVLAGVWESLENHQKENLFYHYQYCKT
jgi:hypothetical protein